MQALVALKLCDWRRESRQPLIRMCEINVPHLCDYHSATPRSLYSWRMIQPRRHDMRRTLFALILIRAISSSASVVAGSREEAGHPVD